MTRRVFANTVLASWCTSKRRCIASLPSPLANPIKQQPTTPFVPPRPYLPRPHLYSAIHRTRKTGPLSKSPYIPTSSRSAKKNKKSTCSTRTRDQLHTYTHRTHTHTHTHFGIALQTPHPKAREQVPTNGIEEFTGTGNERGQDAKG